MSVCKNDKTNSQNNKSERGEKNSDSKIRKKKKTDEPRRKKNINMKKLSEKRNDIPNKVSNPETSSPLNKDIEKSPIENNKDFKEQQLSKEKTDKNKIKEYKQVNNISKKGFEDKKKKKTQKEVINFSHLEIPKDLFYKEKTGYQCKDKNLLKKIYEIQKSFPKTELYLRNQGCKNVPSYITIHRLVQESFKSKSEYNNWRYDIKLREIKDIAEKRLGECLSTEYINYRTKLKFRCEKGHEFEATPGKIKFGGKKGKGTWCPTCSKNKKLTFEEFQEIARERGGECLSTEYKNTYTKLRFLSKRGHEFEITPEHVKYRDQWCPICSERAGEKVCRGLFEAIFNKDFEKARPEWLKNSESHQLEFDGYNDELELAFECQGEQHYKFPNIFHKSLKEFISQLSNDQEKGELCETHRVTLIEVPYWIEFEEYQDYIVKQCKTKGIEIPEIELKIDWKKFKWNIDDDSNRDDDNNRSLMEWM